MLVVRVYTLQVYKLVLGETLQVGVFRMSADHIGCSLAEAAESSAYLQFLNEAAVTPKSLHVIYINTSLETKAQAHALVPTITCTSSNVVQTVLQAFAQIPDLTVWYGPDSYMGANLAEMFQQMLALSDEEIAAVHPSHSRLTISALLPRLHYFLV
jgi:quinolinate synthase